MKPLVSVALPVDVVITTSTTSAACAGVTAVTVVELITFTEVAADPPKVTEVAPVKRIPDNVTPVPPTAGPELAITELISTACSISIEAICKVVLVPCIENAVAETTLLPGV